MTTWNQQHIKKHMPVYSSDHTSVGHVKDIYEDSFAIHHIFPPEHDKYLPYNAIARVEQNEIYLTLSSTDLSDQKWNKRPDYEDHLGDPTQLLYDRGHGVHDPFDPENPS